MARPNEFADRVALVTGGSDGLGLHLVQTLTRLGCHVFFCSRRPPADDAFGPDQIEHAHHIRCDLADPDAAKAMVEEAGAFRGHIDYLVNNAAIDPATPIHDTPTERFDQIVAINLRSQFVVTQAALPYLKKGTGRSVVNLCTTNFMFGFANHSVYNAAKSGIVGLSRSLARDLGPAGIRVNILSPGWIMTRRQLDEKVDESTKQQLIANQCVKQLMTEEHVTPTTLFLLSDASRGICGQNIVVDGGNFLY